MRKVVAVMNITIDGFCDHTAGIADAALHQHYTDLLRSGSVILYGRKTYQLMESYWPTVVKNPTGEKEIDEFGLALQDIKKIVFSRTLKSLTWENVTLAKSNLKDEVLSLKQGKEDNNGSIFIGSPSLIAALTNLQLIDEYQLCIHPVVIGSGLPLFKDLKDKTIFKLVNTKLIGPSGAMVMYYEPSKK
jgi:dihydrofolate reductase